MLWEIIWKEVIGILVETIKEGKRSKIPALATAGYTAVPFWITPLSNNGRDRARAAVSVAVGR